tara:strand:- start:10994 stop:13237 length:2244 start_codon:yes stop_codon:yes gene_type:complete
VSVSRLHSSFARLNFRRLIGGSTAEMLVCTVGFLVFSLGAVQIALNYKTKALVNSATFQAARIGAMENAQKEPMKKELARHLTMMYGSTNTGLLDMQRAFQNAYEDLTKPLLPNSSSGAGLKIDIINPTTEAFQDFGVEVDDQVQIPNSHLKARSREVGESSGVNIQDANLLKIKVTYGYRMYVPIASQMIAKILTLADPENAAYYKAVPPRLPIESTALVRMQSPAIEDGNWSKDGREDDDDESSDGAIPAQGSEGEGNAADSETIDSEASDTYYGDDSDVFGRGGLGDTESGYFSDYTNNGSGSNSSDSTNSSSGNGNNGEDNDSSFVDSVSNEPGIGTSVCDSSVSQGGLDASGETDNPVKIVTGNKMYRELDYKSAGAFPLAFRRHYISRASFTNKAIGLQQMPAAWWGHSYQQHLVFKKNVTLWVQNNSRIYRFKGGRPANGKSIEMNIPNADSPYRIVNQEGDFYLYKFGSPIIEIYDHMGDLKEIRNINLGLSHFIKRFDDGVGKVFEITHSNGDQFKIHLAPESTRRWWQVTRVEYEGGYIEYDYKSYLLYTKLSRFDDEDQLLSTREYVHNSNVRSDLITGILDETGQRYSTVVYNSDGRVYSSAIGDNIETLTFEYTKEGEGDDMVNVTSITNLHGAVTKYYSKHGYITRVVGEPSKNCAGREIKPTSNRFLNIQTYEDENGVKTLTIYNRPEGRVTVTRGHKQWTRQYNQDKTQPVSDTYALQEGDGYVPQTRTTY